MKMSSSSPQAAHTSPANKKYNPKEDTVMSLAFISIFINAQGRRTRLRPKKSVCFYEKRHKKMTTICSDIVLAKICSTKKKNLSSGSSLYPNVSDVKLVANKC